MTEPIAGLASTAPGTAANGGKLHERAHAAARCHVRKERERGREGGREGEREREREREKVDFIRNQCPGVWNSGGVTKFRAQLLTRTGEFLLSVQCV